MKYDGIVSQAADALADKIYEGIKFFFETKIDELATVLLEFVGLALIVCGVIMMFGDLRTWLTRTGIVAVNIGGASLMFKKKIRTVDWNTFFQVEEETMTSSISKCIFNVTLN